MYESIVRTLLEQPILTLFVVIGLGYLVGEISFFGFRFGVAGVLFMGLAVGALHPGMGLPEVIPTLGLIIFVYTLGIQSGPALARSLRERGYRDHLFAIAMVMFGGVLTAVIALLTGIRGGQLAGLFCGALTSTPALAAARETVREIATKSAAPPEHIRLLADQPTVGYSLAYPVGVIGVLLCFQILGKFWRAEGERSDEGPPEIRVQNFLVSNPAVIGRTIGEILRVHKDHGFVVSRVHHAGVTDIATSNTLLHAADIVAVVGDEDSLAVAEHIFGERSNTRIEEDRSRLDYRRFIVSAKEVVGKTIRELDLQNRLHATITRVRRGDVDIVPAPGTRLENGDIIRVLTYRERFPEISKFFGDSIRGTAETDFGSVALGMVLGVLLGMLPLPLPGGSVIRLGLAGGPLLVALFLGTRERTRGITWVIPISANLTLRQVGVLLFLAGVGTRAGYNCLHTLQTSGAQLILAGAAITFGVTLATMLIGRYALRIPFDALMGLMSGIQTQAAAVAFANGKTRSDAPNVAYAAVYPAAMVTKIFLAQIFASWPA